MLRSSSPTKFLLPWAANAGGGFIRTVPVASQIGVQAGAASYNDGFVPDNFTQIAAGGVPPFGQDMNGVLNETTTWDQWYQACAPIYYDAAFATAIGGYPNGTILQSSVSPGVFWYNTLDNVTVDPDSIGGPAAGWVFHPSLIAPGTPAASFSATTPPGFTPADSSTIGNAASNATRLANSQTLLCYRQIWTNFSNTACPIFTSGGVPTTRGANPDADFNANKAISTPDMRGRGIVGDDPQGTGRLAGVPVTQGTVSAPTAIIGENLHPLTSSENGAHTHASFLTDPGHAHTITDPGHAHTYSDPGHHHTVTTAIIGGTANTNSGTAGAVNTGTTNTSSAAVGITINGAVTGITGTNGATTGVSLSEVSSGSGTPHNTVSQSLTVRWNIKL